MKTCTKCGSHGPFYKDSQKKDGFSSQCQKCIDTRVKRRSLIPEVHDRSKITSLRWHKEHPEKESLAHRKSKLKRLYGLTEDSWQLLFERQGKCCAVCKTSNPGNRGWVTDHDHVSGKLRKILCSSCNLGLGMFHDNILVLESAIAYLKEHNR